MDKRAGQVALIGRSTVGKSTLLNRFLGYELMATANQPQTTRHRILGILTRENVQLVFVDTPGIHGFQKRLLNRRLNRTAEASMSDNDLVLFVVEAGKFKQEDEAILARLRDAGASFLLVANKIDQLRARGDLLPWIQQTTQAHGLDEIVPVCALDESSVDYLLQQIIKRLPGVDEFPYPEEMISDRPMSFHSAELVRAELSRALREELPHAMAVKVERFQRGERLVQIDALIFVESDSQKRIVIGKGGQMLKRAGSHARQKIEAILEQQVNLNLWVKVKPDWRNSERLLRELEIETRQ